MKTKIYLIRHGESQANEKGLFLGHGDLDLTERGRAQAQKTAEYLKNVPVDKIYSSDLLRAYNTAETTAKTVGIPVIKSKELREINAGEWEFQPFSLLPKKYPESYRIWLTDIASARPDGGESVAEVQKRTVAEIRRICEENEEKTVFVFTHATTVRAFATYCVSKSIEGIQARPYPTNASVTYAEYENGEFTLVEYSNDSFMGEIATALPSNV